MCVRSWVHVEFRSGARRVAEGRDHDEPSDSANLVAQKRPPSSVLLWASGPFAQRLATFFLEMRLARGPDASPLSPSLFSDVDLRGQQTMPP